MSDPLIELENLAPRISAAIEARKLKNALGLAAQKLAEVPRHAGRLEYLVDATVALRCNREVFAELREAADAAEDVGKLLETADSPENLQHINDDVKSLLSALQILDKAVRQHWKQTVRNEFDPLVAIGDLLSAIQATESLGSRLRSIGLEAKDFAERTPSAEQLAAEISRLRGTRDALETDLHQLTGNPEVDRFLSAVTGRTATLAQVTPAVMDWLQRNNALQAFAVRGIT